MRVGLRNMSPICDSNWIKMLFLLVSLLARRCHSGRKLHDLPFYQVNNSNLWVPSKDTKFSSIPLKIISSWNVLICWEYCNTFKSYSTIKNAFIFPVSPERLLSPLVQFVAHCFFNDISNFLPIEHELPFIQVAFN